MYYIYMIRCDDNSIYTGITTNVSRRMKEHVFKLKEGASYTKSRNVISLEALWMCQNRSQASKLEYKIKKMSKMKKESLIKQPDVFEGYDSLEINIHYISTLKQNKK